MKKFFKWFAISFLVSALGLVVFCWYQNKPLPQGQKSAEADSLAQKMLRATGYDAWQKTNIVAWDFSGGHQYLWDKQRNLVQVQWGNKRVLLNLTDWPKGQAFVDNKPQTGNELDVERGKAWAYFCNDSFWLIAPNKILDEGTERRIVPQKDGKDALLVTYKSGGVTPNDSYLWFLDKNGLPTHYQMWVSILPIGGLEATWESWQKLPTGAQVATKHKLGPVAITIENLKAGQSWQELGMTADPFAGIQ
ncbi:MAG: hypothetical protein EAZ70_07140 [Runella slithyformis]|nr:MAG: hypothetical protein EAY79_06105 [Runella slithyformis]TAF97430.1 MAG: hypothetical protein EAZ46_02320 [Runella sp.]TAG22203.1 MAG: hypothetical protein EAZ38_06280 [Cytophagales bacterium]TAG41292.1 MAG: hypothetical protein EAZ32_03485 [Cytophagia bacterium]TAF27481.1 MAG: hypothetical protein EAZ70_07140 [Runella slithyformis]